MNVWILNVINKLPNVHLYLYYKIVGPYLWTELAPVLEGSGSRLRHPGKGTSVDHVCVIFVACADCRIFLLFVKNGVMVGARSLKVTAGH